MYGTREAHPAQGALCRVTMGAARAAPKRGGNQETRQLHSHVILGKFTF